jgi:hypothetical protein
MIGPRRRGSGSSPTGALRRSCVTGEHALRACRTEALRRCSIKRPAVLWSGRRDSNPLPQPWQGWDVAIPRDHDRARSRSTNACREARPSRNGRRRGVSVTSSVAGFVPHQASRGTAVRLDAVVQERLGQHLASVCHRRCPSGRVAIGMSTRHASSRRRRVASRDFCRWRGQCRRLPLDHGIGPAELSGEVAASPESSGRARGRPRRTINVSSQRAELPGRGLPARTASSAHRTSPTIGANAIGRARTLSVPMRRRTRASG